MKKSSTKTLFLTTLMLSTIMVMSSNNWFGMWMGLEINLLSFIAIIYINKNNYSAESCMIYFLTQSLGSIVFLMMILMNPTMQISSTMMSETCNIIMMASMLLKVGAAPFHFWLPEMMNKLSWMNCMIIMTWQKIAPMSIMTNMIQNNKMMFITITMSTLLGAVGGLNQTSVRKIMAYSSISHLGWMMACMKFENEMWMIYLGIYSIMVIMMTMMFNYYSILQINQMFMNSPKMTEKIVFSSLFLSLGGLPPFLGFLPKWIVIQSLMNKSLYLMLTIMVLTTLITLFYYLRLISTMMLINSTMNKWNLLLKNNNKNMQMMIIMINLMLPMVSTLTMF